MARRTAPVAKTLQLMRRRWQQFAGHDVFISYSRVDGPDYSLALASALAAKQLSCFLDQWGTAPGTRLPDGLIRHLKSSSLLVVVGTPAASASENVEQEINEFLIRDKPVIPIAFVPADGSSGSSPEQLNLTTGWWPKLQGVTVTREVPERILMGPSERVIERIANAEGFVRRNQRLRRAFNTTAAVFAVLLVGGGLILNQLRVRSEEAEHKRATAEAAEKAALQSERNARGRALLAQSAAVVDSDPEAALHYAYAASEYGVDESKVGSALTRALRMPAVWARFGPRDAKFSRESAHFLTPGASPADPVAASTSIATVLMPDGKADGRLSQEPLRLVARRVPDGQILGRITLGANEQIDSSNGIAFGTMVVRGQTGQLKIFDIDDPPPGFEPRYQAVDVVAADCAPYGWPCAAVQRDGWLKVFRRAGASSFKIAVPEVDGISRVVSSQDARAAVAVEGHHALLFRVDESREHSGVLPAIPLKFACVSAPDVAWLGRHAVFLVACLLSERTFSVSAVDLRGKTLRTWESKLPDRMYLENAASHLRISADGSAFAYWCSGLSQGSTPTVVLLDETSLPNAVDVVATYDVVGDREAEHGDDVVEVALSPNGENAVVSRNGRGYSGTQLDVGKTELWSLSALKSRSTLRPGFAKLRATSTSVVKAGFSIDGSRVILFDVDWFVHVYDFNIASRVIEDAKCDFLLAGLCINESARNEVRVYDPFGRHSYTFFDLVNVDHAAGMAVDQTATLHVLTKHGIDQCRAGRCKTIQALATGRGRGRLVERLAVTSDDSHLILWSGSNYESRLALADIAADEASWIGLTRSATDADVAWLTRVTSVQSGLRVQVWQLKTPSSGPLVLQGSYTREIAVEFSGRSTLLLKQTGHILAVVNAKHDGGFEGDRFLVFDLARRQLFDKVIDAIPENVKHIWAPGPGQPMLLLVYAPSGRRGLFLLSCEPKAYACAVADEVPEGSQVLGESWGPSGGVILVRQQGGKATWLDVSGRREVWSSSAHLEALFPPWVSCRSNACAVSDVEGRLSIAREIALGGIRSIKELTHVGAPE